MRKTLSRRNQTLSSINPAIDIIHIAHIDIRMHRRPFTEVHPHDESTCIARQGYRQSKVPTLFISMAKIEDKV